MNVRDLIDLLERYDRLHKDIKVNLSVGDSFYRNVDLNLTDIGFGALGYYINLRIIDEEEVG